MQSSLFPGGRRTALAICVLAVAANAQTPFVPVEPTGLGRIAPETRSGFKTLVRNHALLWSSPARSKDGLKIVVPLTTATAVALALDHRIASALPDTPDQIRYSKAVSNAGAYYSLGAAAGAFVAIGAATHNDRAIRTGLLAAEAVAHTESIAQMLKYAGGRERPDYGDSPTGRFWHGQQSFPSGHAIETWAVATVISREYSDNRFSQVRRLRTAGAGERFPHQALSFGLWAPRWQRTRYADLREAGRFEAEAFNPHDWKPIYPNPAFVNRLPDDTYWAAKQVMAFSDDETRKLVELGQYADPRTVDHMTDILIKRRDKLGRTFLEAVTLLDNFSVAGGKLVFDDLAVRYGFREPRSVSAEWLSYHQQGGRGERMNASGMNIPSALQGAPRGMIAIASIRLEGAPPAQAVDVHLRKAEGARWDVVGIWRTW